MRKPLLKALVFTGTLVALLALPGSAHADIVTSLHSDVTVTRDNVVTVRETVVYDPQDGDHHGIYRYVPAQFKDEAGHTYYTRVKLVSVTDAAGVDYNIADQSLDRQQLYLKIGDADETISGPHTYIITYQITPLVLKADGHDRFIFNVTGQGWQTGIASPSASIHFDTATDVTTAACYTGPTGSRAHDCTATVDPPRDVAVQSGPLDAGNGLTVDIKLAPGSVTSYLQPDVVPPLTAGDRAALGVGLLALALALAAAIRVLWVWWQDRRERRSQIIIPLYEPPDGLSPAQMSILESPGTDVADVTATLIDLAVRGFIKIEQTRPKAWYRAAQYRLQRLPGSGTIAPYESGLLDALFDGSDAVDLQDLKYDTSRAQDIQKAISGMRKTIGQDLKSKQYYVTSPTLGLGLWRIIALVIGGSTSVITIAFVENGQSYSWWVPALALVFAAVGCGLSLVRTDRTLLGNQEWAKVEGFKWFLNVTEKARLAFTDAPDKTPELFSKMLPYAVALKVEKEWAKQFEGIDVSRSIAGWYVGATILDSSSFTGDFSSSFGGAVSSNFAGSSGSGSAGGGGGGGGGGGW